VDTPVGGDEGTVAQTRIDEADAAHAAVVASWRAVWDLDGAGTGTLPTGVSGNPASPHWNDQAATYASGAPTDHDTADEVLTLEPG